MSSKSEASRFRSASIAANGCTVIRQAFLTPAAALEHVAETAALYVHRWKEFVLHRDQRKKVIHFGTAMRKAVLLPVFFGAYAGLSPAETSAAEDLTARDLLQDAKLYFTAPVRWDGQDWLFFCGALAAIGAAHEYDADVRRHFAVGDRAILNGRDNNSLRDAIPIAAVIAGTWAFAGLVDDQAGKVESYTMIEAATFSLITTEGLKFAAGRETPNETTRVDAWRQGGSSFPSLHASAAFAVGTVLAESGGDDFRWIRRVLGYGMASTVAYVRMHENVHWLSDTVAGAAVGIATAEFTMHRRDERTHRWELSVAPVPGGGTELAITMRLR